MKTSLDHLPRRKQTELKRVVDVLFAEFDDMLKLATSQQKKRGRILKIILYGSYARGDWVEDRASGYMSDYDVLVIVNQRHLDDDISGDLRRNGSGHDCRLSYYLE